MDSNRGDLALVLAHERKLVETLDFLKQARERVLAAAADVRDSSLALKRQAALAECRSHQLLVDGAGLTATAERLFVEAKAIHGELDPLALTSGEK